MCSYPDTNIYPRLFVTLYFHFLMFLLFYIVVVVFFKQEFQKILFEYDKDGDGELSGQEMSKYIEDTLVGIFGTNYCLNL